MYGPTVLQLHIDHCLCHIKCFTFMYPVVPSAAEQITGGKIKVEFKFGIIPVFVHTFDLCDMLKLANVTCPVAPGQPSATLVEPVPEFIPKVNRFIVLHRFHVWGCCWCYMNASNYADRFLPFLLSINCLLHFRWIHQALFDQCISAICSSLLHMQKEYTFNMVQMS